MRHELTGTGRTRARVDQLIAYLPIGAKHRPKCSTAGAFLDGFNNDVLVGLVVLVLNEVVKEAWPRFGIVIGAEVAVPDGLDQVKEHVPRIAGDAVGGRLR